MSPSYGTHCPKSQLSFHFFFYFSSILCGSRDLIFQTRDRTQSPALELWSPTPVFLPGESHGRRSLVGCSPQGRKELGTTEQLHFTSLTTGLPGKSPALFLFFYLFIFPSSLFKSPYVSSRPSPSTLW